MNKKYMEHKETNALKKIPAISTLCPSLVSN